jgi:cation:H+ antiporter
VRVVIPLWITTTAVGLALAVLASTRAVDHAVRAASGLGVPAFVVGVTVLAVGTDLPEIANSVAASLAGHGDVNVGDSIGSAAAQAALVLGLVPVLVGPVPVERGHVRVVGVATTVVLLGGTWLMADGRLGRVDGLVLVAAWVLSVRVVRRSVGEPVQPELPLPDRHPAAHVTIAVLWLLLVAGGATVAVASLVRVADALGLPEYLVSFTGLALGTSLPELTVAVTAARRRQPELALGDALGASLADASLSLGAGPLVAPTTVTAALAVPGGLATAALVGVVTLVLATRTSHTRSSGAILMTAYVVVVPLVLGGRA